MSLKNKCDLANWLEFIRQKNAYVWKSYMNNIIAKTEYILIGSNLNNKKHNILHNIATQPKINVVLIVVQYDSTNSLLNKYLLIVMTMSCMRLTKADSSKIKIILWMKREKETVKIVPQHCTCSRATIQQHECVKPLQPTDPWKLPSVLVWINTSILMFSETMTENFVCNFQQQWKSLNWCWIK